jgi:hypothetical protein
MQGGDRAELERSWCMGVEVTQFDVDVFALVTSQRLVLLDLSVFCYLAFEYLLPSRAS